MISLKQEKKSFKFLQNFREFKLCHLDGLFSPSYDRLMDITKENEETWSNDGDELEAADFSLSRLGARNVSAIWGHGLSVSLFNSARRSKEVPKKSIQGPNADSPVLAMSWDNYMIARQVCPLSLFIIRFCTPITRADILRLFFYSTVGLRIPCSLLQHTGASTKFSISPLGLTRRQSTISRITSNSCH